MTGQDTTPANPNNASAPQSIVDKVTGVGKQIYGKLVNDPNAEARGVNQEQEGRAKDDLSHSTVRGPGFTVNAQGGAAPDHPDRTAGSWNQTMGAAKESLGGMIGNENLKQTGREQNREGQAQEVRGQAEDLKEGMAERAKGTIGAAGASLVGDRQTQAEYNARHDVGKAQQRGVEADLNRESEAREHERQREFEETRRNQPNA